jgi:hypothetical protein
VLYRVEAQCRREGGRTFLKAYTGDFNGDGKDDPLLHSGNSILLHRSNGARLDLVFSSSACPDLAVRSQRSVQ